MITTATGLQYEDTVVGEGDEAKKGQSVTVHYTGWLFNEGEKGVKFDSSLDRRDPFVFSLGQGWQQGTHAVSPGWGLVAGGDVVEQGAQLGCGNGHRVAHHMGEALAGSVAVLCGGKHGA